MGIFSWLFPKRREIETVQVRTQFETEYDSKYRLASYWHQVDECRKIGGQTVLLIGTGSGMSTVMLERAGFQVTSVDIQAHLAPNVTGDVRALPFADHSLDIATCCQVLEHLPYEFFVPSLGELRRVVRNGVVLSLPDSGKYSTTFSRIFGREEMLTLPRLWRKTRKGKQEHFWEVNLPGYSLHDVQRDIDRSQLKTMRTFRVWEHPYHRFWRLLASH
jgi:ubiquinone/menaquinone biosynthesis C-methylase UbiE